jgi:hypothetical protein
MNLSVSFVSPDKSFGGVFAGCGLVRRRLDLISFHIQVQLMHRIPRVQQPVFFTAIGGLG